MNARSVLRGALTFSPSLRTLATLATLLVCPPVHAQGMPVIDAQSILQQIQELNTLVQQLQELKSQVKQLEETYSSLTGNRGLGTILNLPQNQLARRYLPADLPTLSSLAAGAATPPAGTSALQSRIASLTGQVSSLPPHYYPDGSAAAVQLQSTVGQLATRQATAEAAYGAAAGHLPDLEGMIATLGTTADTKGAAEIQARIQAETALIGAEQNRLSALILANQAAESIARQQDDDALRQAGRRQHPPIAF